MLIRISIAIIAVMLCFNFPVYYDNAYTELSNLRENALRSSVLIVVMMILSRGWAAYLISFIELSLIAINGYMALNWGDRGSILVAVHYTELQMTAYMIELAILCIAILFGAAMIGTSDDHTNNRLPIRWFHRNYRALRR